jgi:hypothetical protein
METVHVDQVISILEGYNLKLDDYARFIDILFGEEEEVSLDELIRHIWDAMTELTAKKV